MKIGRKIAILFAIIGLAFSAATCGSRALGNNATESGITGSGNVATAPTVTSTTPSDGTSSVNGDSTIQINFSVSVNAATVTMTSNTTCTGSVQVSVDNFANCLPMNQTITQSGTQVTVRTASLMTIGVQHRVRVTTALAGVTGLTMQTQYEFTFNTTGGQTVTAYSNEFGTNCSGGLGTISAFKTAATGTEGAVGPIVISGLVVTGIDRFGSFYLQKGTEGIYVDVNTNAGACGGPNCQGNKASHYGMQVGDEICLSITRAVESNNVDTVKDYDAIKKTGIGSVTPAVLTDVFAVADISEWVRISGFLTTKTSGGNVNHTLTFADGKTITIRDNTSNKFTSVNQNDYVQITSVSSWFGGTAQIMVDTGVGTVSTGLTAPAYSVTGTVSGWSAGENFTLTLNGANATVISANGAFSFTGSPTVTGQYTVAMSVNPPNNECVLGSATGFATANITSVTVTCTPKPMYRFETWADTEASSTYPLASQLFTTTTLDGGGSLQTLAASYPNLYTAAYNGTSGSRINGGGADGLIFRNTGSGGTYMGAMVLTLDTTGKTNMRLNWTGRTVTALDRPYRIAVQTRTNSTNAWTNNGSFYAANGTAGHSQTFTAVDISALDNQIAGQVRFVYYQEGAGGSNRPNMGLDDVIIYSASNAKPWLTGFSPAVSATGVSVTPTVSVTFNKSMNTGTVTTGNLYIVAGTNCSNTAITATISASNSDRTFTFSPTGLTGSTQYSTCVKAAIADTTGDTIGTDRMISWTTTAVDVTAPSAVSTLAAGTITSSSVVLNWTAVGDDAGTGTATTYAIRYATGGSCPFTDGNFASTGTLVGSPPTPQVAGSAETKTVTGLSASTQYWFAIKVSDEVPNTSTISNCITGTTSAPDVTAPSAVSTLATGTVTSSSVVLNWTAVGDDAGTGTAASYDIRYATGGSCPFTDGNFASTGTLVGSPPTPQAAGNAETKTVTGLSASTQYWFALKVNDEVPNTSTISNCVTATTSAGGGTPVSANTILTTYVFGTGTTCTGDYNTNNTASAVTGIASISSIAITGATTSGCATTTAPAATYSMGSSSWASGNGPNPTKYHELTFDVSTGYTLAPGLLTANLRPSGTGPSRMAAYISTNTYGTAYGPTGAGTTCLLSNSAFVSCTFDFTSVGVITGPTTVRIRIAPSDNLACNSSSGNPCAPTATTIAAGGTLRIDDVIFRSAP